MRAACRSAADIGPSPVGGRPRPRLDFFSTLLNHLLRFLLK
jgi:hypothetical protein